MDITGEYIQRIVQKEPIVLAYFSNSTCNVCKILRPKIEALINTNFPKIKFIYIDCELSQEVCGQNRVFSIPTVIIFTNGQESLRFSRFINIDELNDKLSRYYNFFFNSL